MKFAKISSIEPENEDSWRDRVFLTFDFDWASDEILEHVIDIVERADIEATWFVTHDTPVLDRLRSNQKFELGLHPNFNPLLSPSGSDRSREQSAETILFDLREILPDARSVRSHSMTQSSRLLDIFAEAGLTLDCNHFIPHNSGMALRPWRHWNGMVKVPHFWEDDIWVMEGRKTILGQAMAVHGLRVFDFHPIHIALNSADMGVYEKTRSLHGQWNSLKKHIHQGDGVGTFFDDLLTFDNCSFSDGDNDASSVRGESRSKS